MNDVEVVGFDGSPVAGGIGVRTPILKHLDSSLTTPDGRTLFADELERLVASGHVTPVEPSIRCSRIDGRIVYRHREYVFPGVMLDTPGLNWLPVGDIELTYLERSAALRLLERYARLADYTASAELAKQNYAQARLYARRGLMATPCLTESEIAARLYGVLFVAELRDRGRIELIHKEIRLTLDATRVQQAMAVINRLLPPSQSSSFLAKPGPRKLDVPLTVGAERAPRKVA